MNYYRPVSHLCFLYKLVEWCMLKQLINHCNTDYLIPDFQSAYRENCSTVTSPIRMCSDMLWSMEKLQITMMVILISWLPLTQLTTTSYLIFCKTTIESQTMPYIGLKPTYNHTNLRCASATNTPGPNSYPLGYPRDCAVVPTSSLATVL